MGIGESGKEQFRRAILTIRNRHIAAGMAPLMLFREEVVTNDDLQDRGGVDDKTRDHFLQLLLTCDKMRRRVTHNPDNVDLGTALAKAIDPQGSIEAGQRPFGGDDIQGQSGGLFDVPWALDGSDVNIPLNSLLELTSNLGKLLLAAVDDAIVNWTRLNSRDRTQFVTAHDSLRIYGKYQTIYEFLVTFGGDANRTDVAQVLPSEEPLGPEDSPNRKTETSGRTASA